MKRINRILALGGIMAASFAATAQNTNSGYFLDGYTYRYQMNPAFGNDRHFISMPALGNLNVAVRGTLNLSSVVYSLNGRTVLFTNPGISASEVIGNINDKSSIGTGLKLNILSAGFKAFGGYNTVSINAKANIDATLPKSFFSLAKEGLANKTYDISNLRARAIGYAEIAFNHSHDIKALPGLRVGAAVKALVGVANLDAYFNEADLTLGNDEWIARTNADIYASIGGFQYEHKMNKKGKEYVSGMNFDGDGSIGPNGFGLAFDLGATYQLGDFNFSIAALDLGWISFNDTHYATTGGTRTVNTDAFTFNANDDAGNSFSNEWKRLRDNLEDLYQLEDRGNIGSHKVGLGATLNVGVDYALPVYHKLHFGLLSSTRFQDDYTWSEVRLSANVAPVKCFSADANIAVGTYGVGFGWLLNFHTKGYNLFLGMDRTLGKVTKEFAPLNSNASVNFGMNFLF